MGPLIIPFFIPHEGCPNDCSFCNQRIIAGQSEGLPSHQRIYETVKEWLARSPGRPAEVAFYGGSFTMLPLDKQEYLLGSVKPLIKEQLVNSLRISTRPDALSPDILEFLKKHNVRTVEIGVQSLDDNVLKLAGRGHTAADSITAIKRTVSAGFVTGAQLLPFLPGDTLKSILDSAKRVIDAGARLIRVYPAIVLANTRLADLYKSGEWQPATVDDAVIASAVILNMASRSGVSVIRVGLQSDEGLVSGETILSGPWHPAFGQLVRGELYFALARKLSCVTTEPVTGIFCHPKRISDVAGHSRRNIERLGNIGINLDFIEIDHSLCREEIIVKTLNHNFKGSIVTDLNNEEIIHA